MVFARRSFLSNYPESGQWEGAATFDYEQYQNSLGRSDNGHGNRLFPVLARHEHCGRAPTCSPVTEIG